MDKDIKDIYKDFNNLKEAVVDITDVDADLRAENEELRATVVRLNTALTSYQDIVRKIPRWCLKLLNI